MKHCHSIMVYMQKNPCAFLKHWHNNVTYQIPSIAGCRVNEIKELELDLILLFKSSYISNKAMRSHLRQIVINVLACDRRISNKLKQLPYGHHCNIALLEKVYQETRSETKTVSNYMPHRQL